MAGYWRSKAEVRCGETWLSTNAMPPVTCNVLVPFQQASQLTCQTYAEAVRHATQFAVKGDVDAWYIEDGQTYRSLAVHRGGRQGRSSKHES